MRRFLIGISLALATLGASCPGVQYSENETVALAQKFAATCRQLEQSIISALALASQGHLTEDEARIVDRIDAIYRPVCTGPPRPLDESLKDAGAQAAVAELCPELVASAPGDALLTISEAASCAARKALILQLGEPA